MRQHQTPQERVAVLIQKLDTEPFQILLLGVSYFWEGVVIDADIFPVGVNYVANILGKSTAVKFPLFVLRYLLPMLLKSFRLLLYHFFIDERVFDFSGQRLEGFLQVVFYIDILFYCLD